MEFYGLIPQCGASVCVFCGFVCVLCTEREGKRVGLFPMSAVSGSVDWWVAGEADGFGMVGDGISVVCRARSVTFASSPSLTLLSNIGRPGCRLRMFEVEVGECERTYVPAWWTCCLYIILCIEYRVWVRCRCILYPCHPSQCTVCSFLYVEEVAYTVYARRAKGYARIHKHMRSDFRLNLCAYAPLYSLCRCWCRCRPFPFNST